MRQSPAETAGRANPKIKINIQKDFMSVRPQSSSLPISSLAFANSPVSLQKHSSHSPSQLHQQRQRQKGERIHPGPEQDHSNNDYGVEGYLLPTPWECVSPKAEHQS